jgi:hypothetical protein
VSARPVSALERLDAILCNPATYELALVIPEVDRRRGGRPRHYPAYMLLVFEALISIYGSARQVGAELSHPVVWNHACALVRERFCGQLHLPPEPIRRHHYLYAREWLLNTGRLDILAHRHRELAAA